MINWEWGEPGHPGLCTLVVGRQHLPNYVYILAYPSGEAIVVDPGFEADLIRGELDKFNVELRAVLLTHGHSDHLAVVPEIVQGTDVPVFLMEGEEIDYGYAVPNVVRCQHDQPFDVGAIQIHPFGTPGHSPGSACYLVGDKLFTGDTVFMESVGDCPEQEGSMYQLFDSIKMLKLRIKDDTKIYPGHCFRTKLGCSFGTVKRENVYFRIDEPDAFVSWHRRFIGDVEKGGGKRCSRASQSLSTI